jgi:hypothetical protein
MWKKNRFIYTTLFACIAVIQSQVIAQQSTAKATIQPAEILIGQQATINLEVIAPKGHKITFPVYKDTLVNGIEVLDMPVVDTVIAHEVMTLTKKYIVTSFDSALYFIPTMPVLDGTDTIKSNSFGLKVASPPLSEATLDYLEQLKQAKSDSINFEKLGVYDIKDIQYPPFVWKDYILYIFLFLLLVGCIIALIIGIRLYRKKTELGFFFKPKTVLPPHILALNALNKIRDEKLWQQGREKEYFTELTDILREYIQKRFYVNAFEMTSDEILSAVHNIIEADSSYDSLSQVLKLADLVKFAKYKPFPNENDLSMVNSILFVNQTKQEELATEFQEGANQSEDMDNNNQNEEETPIDWTIPIDGGKKTPSIRI